ncbi:Ribonuclease R [Methylocella tundrae]|uniref:Ribonuclease R n=1 Tax=Methylocella tundrae TaxID=227605 RepID=A0A8B6M4K0_METTU|nr:Ribonuclease R [Methylocella tundrae]
MNKPAGPGKSGSKAAQGAQQTTRPAPSREDIVAFIAREREAQGEQMSSGRSPAKISKREIARAFDIRGDDRIALKRLLKELEAEGAIERRRKGLHKAGLLPATVLADFFSRDRDGDFLAAPVDWDAAQGPQPKIIVGIPRRQRPGAPAPGVGDRALLRVEPLPDAKPGEPAYSGRVVKLLERARSQILGIFRERPGGGGRVLPVDKKNANRGELDVHPGQEGDAREGDLVAVEILRTGRLGLPSARVRERLGAFDSEKAVSLIAIHTHKIPNVFRPETIAEADRARPATMDGREDWRQIPLVTIDPADAKDHDDAVHAEADPDPNNRGGFILRVAIADVAAYVRPGSPLDRDALERGNSVYFPDRVVPMLPERISNDLCSLRPHEDRPALAVRMVVAADGHKLTHSFHRVMMRSAAKLAYGQAQAAIDGAADETTAPLVAGVLAPLYEAYAALKRARDARGPLDLDLPERKIILNEEGGVHSVVIPARLDAHRLIEEFMILANVAAAETLEAKHQALIYRAHDEPSVEKLNNLAEFLSSIGIKLAKGQVIRAEQFNGILAQVKDTDNEHLVNEIVLRTQAQAEYVVENYGHFGLNLHRYAHFTSPIRRYADLIVHRALISALRLGPDGLPPNARDELTEVAAKISAAERRAMAAERETIERLIAAHLADKVGATFEGRISGATRAGLFIRLSDTGADGFIPASMLGDDYFRHDERLHALIGSRTGKMHRLGDIVTVKLVEAAPLAGALRFELLSAGGPRAPRTALKQAGKGEKAQRHNRSSR